MLIEALPLHVSTSLFAMIHQFTNLTVCPGSVPSSVSLLDVFRDSSACSSSRASCIRRFLTISFNVTPLIFNSCCRRQEVYLH